MFDIRLTDSDKMNIGSDPFMEYVIGLLRSIRPESHINRNDVEQLKFILETRYEDLVSINGKLLLRYDEKYEHWTINLISELLENEWNHPFDRLMDGLSVMVIPQNDMIDFRVYYDKNEVEEMKESCMTSSEWNRILTIEY
jgi:hypothetical protein